MAANVFSAIHPNLKFLQKLVTFLGGEERDWNLMLAMSVTS